MAADFSRSSQSCFWTLDRQTVEGERKRLNPGMKEEEILGAIAFQGHLIQQVGMKMGAPMQVVATAITYLRRFLSKCPIGGFDCRLLACACTSLAHKAEEFGHLNIIRFFVLVNEHVSHLRYSVEGAKFDKQTVQGCEMVLVEVMEASLIVFLPYRYLDEAVDHARLLVGSSEEGGLLYENAWCFINDSYATDACLLCAPSEVAAASIFVSGALSSVDVSDIIRHAVVSYDKIFFVVQLVLESYCLANGFEVGGGHSSVISMILTQHNEGNRGDEAGS